MFNPRACVWIYVGGAADLNIEHMGGCLFVHSKSALIAILKSTSLICLSLFLHSLAIVPSSHNVKKKLAATCKIHMQDTQFILLQHAGLLCVIYSWYYINCMYACIYCTSYLCSCTHRLLPQVNTCTRT